MAMRVKLDIDNRTIIRIALLLVAIWASIQVIAQIKHALILILLSLFLTLALNKPVIYIASKITKGKGGRGLATGIAYLCVLTVVGGFLYLTVPPIIAQARDFISNIPQSIDNLNDSSDGGAISDFITRYDLQDETDEFVSRATDQLSNVAAPLVTGAGKVLTGLVSVITVLVMTFFMLVEGPKWSKLFWDYTPKSKLEHNKRLASQIQDVVTSYVNGQLVIALLAGISSMIMMLIIGLPNAIALAGVVALFALVPMIGTIVGATVIILITLLTQSVPAALAMLVFFVVYQQIENNTAQPFIQSRALNISPLVIFVSVIIGFALAGIIGGFLIIPIVAAGQILLIDYLERRKLLADSK